MKKTIAMAILLTFLILGGCSDSPAEIAEQVTETKFISAEISESEAAENTSAITTSVTSETEIFCDESVFSETAETDSPYSEDVKPPRVIPAEELYGAYPVKIIYTERQDVSDKVKTDILQEDLYTPDGLKALEFYAEYPVLSGYDEAVCKKINDTIQAFIDEIYNGEKSWVESHEFDKNETLIMEDYGTPIYKRTINMDGTYFDGFGYDINGNIFSVYFADNNEYFQGAHGSEHPLPMMFDLRTGDKIVFSELVEDNDGMNRAFAETYQRGALMYGEVPCGELDADIMAEYLKKDDWINNIIKSKEARTSDDRIIALDGCIGFLLAPYENGSFGDGVRLWQLPADEFIPYMNDEGKALFEGYVSAESEPPKVIEYKGKRWFDNTEWIPLVVQDKFDIDEFREQLTEDDREFASMFENARSYDRKKYGVDYSEPLIIRDISDEDREFMSLFPDAYILELNGCRIGSFEEIAEMKNIEMLGLKYCDFDGISALLGSNINYIYGAGHNIPYEQAREFMAQGEEHSHYIAGSVINDEYGISSWLGY